MPTPSTRTAAPAPAAPIPNSPCRLPPWPDPAAGPALGWVNAPVGGFSRQGLTGAWAVARGWRTVSLTQGRARAGGAPGGGRMGAEARPERESTRDRRNGGRGYQPH